MYTGIFVTKETYGIPACCMLALNCLWDQRSLIINYVWSDGAESDHKVKSRCRKLWQHTMIWDENVYETGLKSEKSRNELIFLASIGHLEMEIQPYECFVTSNTSNGSHFVFWIRIKHLDAIITARRFKWNISSILFENGMNNGCITRQKIDTRFLVIFSSSWGFYTNALLENSLLYINRTSKFLVKTNWHIGKIRHISVYNLTQRKTPFSSWNKLFDVGGGCPQGPWRDIPKRLIKLFYFSRTRVTSGRISAEP